MVALIIFVQILSLTMRRKYFLKGNHNPAERKTLQLFPIFFEIKTQNPSVVTDTTSRFNIMNNTQLNKDDDFYAPLFANTSVKIILVVLSLIITPISITLMSAIIWYERFGSDLKRNLTNRMVSLMFQSGIQYLLICQTLTFAR